MFQGRAIATMLVPDPRGDGWAVAVPLLQAAFQKTKRRVVPQYRDGDCEVRRIWDAAAAQVMGVSPERIGAWRALLNAEPILRRN